MSALEIQRLRASAIARELVDRSPANSITCIFAGGSLARGEVWCAQIGGTLEVYSDVDLYAVVAGESVLAPVRAAAAAITGPPVAGARFLRAPDVGVYTRADLLAQPARPGTIDLSVSHVLLHGDPKVPAGLPAPGQSRMAQDESLYLLENRIAELRGAEPGANESEARMAMVQSLKARLDVHAAHAIVDGSFLPSRAERAARFEAAGPRTLDADAREDVADAYRAAVDPGAWFPERDAGAEIERALRALMRAWRALAGGVLASPRGASLADLLAARCGLGARMDNAREVVRLRRRSALPAWKVVAAAPSLSHFSPRAALRMDALVRRFHASGECDAGCFGAHEDYVNALTRVFGFTEGPLESRVRAMQRMLA